MPAGTHRGIIAGMPADEFTSSVVFVLGAIANMPWPVEHGDLRKIMKPSGRRDTVQESFDWLERKRLIAFRKTGHILTGRGRREYKENRHDFEDLGKKVWGANMWDKLKAPYNDYKGAEF